MIYKLFSEDIFTCLIWLTLLRLVPSQIHVTRFPYESFLILSFGVKYFLRLAPGLAFSIHQITKIIFGHKRKKERQKESVWDTKTERDLFFERVRERVFKIKSKSIIDKQIQNEAKSKVQYRWKEPTEIETLLQTLKKSLRKVGNDDN